MRSSFKATLEKLRADAEYEWRKHEAKLSSDAALENALGSSRRWIVVQDEMRNAISSFGESVLLRLDGFEPEHSPYGPEAFDEAADEVRAFAQYLENLYRDESKLRPFGGTKPRFETEPMNHRIAIACDRIYEAKAEFRSRRSHVKSALIWAKNNPVPVVSFVLVAAIVGLSAVSGIQAPDWLLQVLRRS